MSPETKPANLINPEGLRIDGRRIDEMRPVEMKVGVLKQADGSASIRHKQIDPHQLDKARPT